MLVHGNPITDFAILNIFNKHYRNQTIYRKKKLLHNPLVTNYYALSLHINLSFSREFRKLSDHS